MNITKYLLRAGKWIAGLIGFAASAFALGYYLSPSRIEWILLIGFIGLALLAVAQLFQTSDLPRRIAESLKPSQADSKANPGVPEKPKTTGGGTIGGGVIGGIIGTMIAPGIGTIIGAILGAIAGNTIEEQQKKKPPSPPLK